MRDLKIKEKLLKIKVLGLDFAKTASYGTNNPIIYVLWFVFEK